MLSLSISCYLCDFLRVSWFLRFFCQGLDFSGISRQHLVSCWTSCQPLEYAWIHCQDVSFTGIHCQVLDFSKILCQNLEYDIFVLKVWVLWGLLSMFWFFLDRVKTNWFLLDFFITSWLFSEFLPRSVFWSSAKIWIFTEVSGQDLNSTRFLCHYLDFLCISCQDPSFLGFFDENLKFLRVFARIISSLEVFLPTS